MNDTEIFDRLDKIERKLDALLAAVKAQPTTSVRTAGNAPGAHSDLDADIDGPRGNPEVRFSPKRWSGADCKGRKFSECEPEFLDLLADAYEWFAQRDDEQNAVDKNGSPKSKWSRLDAARARAWAQRLRGVDGGDSGNGGSREDTVPRPRKTQSSTSRTSRPQTVYESDNGFGSNYGDDIPF